MVQGPAMKICSFFAGEPVVNHLQPRVFLVDDLQCLEFPWPFLQWLFQISDQRASPIFRYCIVGYISYIDSIPYRIPHNIPNDC